MRLPILIGMLVLMLLGITGAAWAEEAKPKQPGFLGIEMKDLDKAEAEALGLDAPVGVRVVKPLPGSPAEKQGVAAGDVILSIDGQETANGEAFRAAVGSKGPGASIKLRLIRDGKLKTLSVTLAERPAEQEIAATPPAAAPQLMLDTGGHMALIRGLTFTPDGQFIVSAGEDKVIRVWDWRQGKTVRTIRGEAAAGHEGKIYALALSPDGKWLAVGGWLHKECSGRCGDIRLYDFASGALVGLLAGHANVVNAIAFSPDGQRLISGSGDKTAILWDVASRTALHKLEGHTDDIYAAGFTPDGARAVTGSYDNTLRLWNVADGERIATLEGHKDKVYSLAISRGPKGLNTAVIASGSIDGEIRLWDAATGRFLRVLAQPGSWVGALRFSANGRRLLSTAGSSPGIQHVWDVAGGQDLVAYNGHDGTVAAAAISPDGTLAATGGGDNKEIHLWELATGIPVPRIELASRKPEVRPKGVPLVLAGRGAPAWAAGFSADGRRIAWGRTADGIVNSLTRPLEFQLRLPNATAPLGNPEPVIAPSEFVRATPTDGAVSLVHRKGGDYGYDDAILDIVRNGKTTASISRGMTDGYGHSAFTFVPGARAIVSGGGNGVLTAYDLTGKKTGDFIGHTGDIWAVTPSPDGRLLISGSADQTVRLWNLATREPIVSLSHSNDGDWVMWTEQGFYTGSDNAGALVGWQLNHGPDKAAEYVTGRQFRDKLRRPDIVERAIVLASATAAVKEAFPDGFDLARLLETRAPEIAITAPASGDTTHAGFALLTVEARGTAAVDHFDVLVNGTKAQAEPFPVTPGDKPAVAGQTVWRLKVPLFGEDKGEVDNLISVRAVAQSGITSEAAETRIKQKGAGSLEKLGTLHILAVGVDKYPGLGSTCRADDGTLTKTCDLRFAGADARLFAETVEKEIGRQHERVSVRVLASGGKPEDAPAHGNILAAFDTLSKAGPRDTVAVLVAAHGETGKDGRYYLLPTDVSGRTMSDAGSGRNLIAWTDLRDRFNKGGGRRLLFMDACKAGAANLARAYNDRLAEDAQTQGFAAFVAAGPNQLAKENASLGGGHGYFTFALSQGLDGDAMDKDERSIRLLGLSAYLAKAVRSATGGTQEPQYFASPHLGDIVLVRK